MQIDSHQHFWRYDPARHDWINQDMSVLMRDFLPEHLIPELSAHGIDGCVAVQADQSEDETIALLDLAAQNRQIMGVVGWVDLAAPNVDARLEYFSKFKKLRGLRHIAQAEPDDSFLLRDDFCRGVGLLRHFDLAYDILIYARQLPAAIQLAERFPDQKFVLDHIAKPAIRDREIEPWAANIRRLAASHNVYCKVSGMDTEARWANWVQQDFTPYLDVVFEAFGAERLMFGSDWPVCLVAGNYSRVREVLASYMRDFPAEQQQRILGLNAVRFYGLDAVQHGSPA